MAYNLMTRPPTVVVLSIFLPHQRNRDEVDGLLGGGSGCKTELHLHCSRIHNQNHAEWNGTGAEFVLYSSV